jgi:hypothetical protein
VTAQTRALNPHARMMIVIVMVMLLLLLTATILPHRYFTVRL